MSTEIVTGSAVKEMIMDGWELWHIANRQYPKLPGHWEMRKRHKIQRVNWCAIEKLRQRSLKWFDENTTESQVGIDWVYRPMQTALLV